LIIQKENGEIIKTKETPLTLLSLWRSSVDHKTKTEELSSKDGLIHVETTYGPRELRGKFFFDSRDIYDYFLILHEIYVIFSSKKPFYLIHDEREPGKRWKVQAKNTFDPEKIGNYGSFEIDFISYSPFCESVGTSLDDRTFDSELWQFGQNLLAEDISYTHTSNNFMIYNAGDEHVNPREHELTINITANEPANNLIITNTTTGEEWEYTGSINTGDILTIDGIKSYKNGSSVFRDTNRKLISLARGENDITVSGLTDFEISFDFRFLYL